MLPERPRLQSASPAREYRRRSVPVPHTHTSEPLPHTPLLSPLTHHRLASHNATLPHSALASLLASHTPCLTHPLPHTPLASHTPCLTHPLPHTPLASPCGSPLASHISPLLPLTFLRSCAHNPMCIGTDNILVLASLSLTLSHTFYGKLGGRGDCGWAGLLACGWLWVGVGVGVDVGVWGCERANRERGGAGVMGEYIPSRLDQVDDAERARRLGPRQPILFRLGRAHTHPSRNRSAPSDRTLARATHPSPHSGPHPSPGTITRCLGCSPLGWTACSSPPGPLSPCLGPRLE